jgi:hypothetical protein
LEGERRPSTLAETATAVVLRALALSLVLAASALAQDATPTVGQPLDPALTGTWELVEMNVPDADINPVRMTVTFDGNEATTEMAFVHEGEMREEAFTAACSNINGVIQCVTTGDKGGRHNGFGRSEVTGDTLRFTFPGSDYFAVFRRVSG